MGARDVHRMLGSVRVAAHRVRPARDHDAGLEDRRDNWNAHHESADDLLHLSGADVGDVQHPLRKPGDGGAADGMDEGERDGAFGSRDHQLLSRRARACAHPFAGHVFYRQAHRYQV